MQLLMPWGWTLTLRQVGVPLTGRAGFDIYYRSSILRYLPGSLWYLPNRAYLCQQRGIPLASFTRSVSLELYSLLTIGGILGGAAAALRLRSIWPGLFGAACLLGLILIWLNPGWVQRAFGKSSDIDLQSGRWPGLMRIFLVYAGMWLAYGLAVALLLMGSVCPSYGRWAVLLT